MELAQHNVTKVELSKTFVENGGSRTIRITALNFHGQEIVSEMTLYGETDALEALPRSDDFTAHSMKQNAA